MSRESLGDFEWTVLLGILQLGGQAYGAELLEEIERRTDRAPNSGSLYVALRRLERRGLLTSFFGDPTPERGGRAKRYFRIQPEAIQLLRRTQELWSRMSEGLDLALEGDS